MSPVQVSATLLVDDALIALRREDRASNPGLLLEAKVPVALAWRAGDEPKGPELANVAEKTDAGALLLEDVEGESLASIFARSVLSQQNVIGVLKEAAAALDRLHAEGRVHGAVRPSALWIAPGRRALIVDWMFAWHELPLRYLAAQADVLTPERLRGEPAGPAADQFSLAVVAHRLLTGRDAFPGDSLAEKLLRVMRGLWDDPGARSAPATSRVYGRVFAPLPRDRYASCSEFVAALESACAERVQVETRFVSEPSALPSLREAADRAQEIEPAKVTKAHPAWWIAIAAGVLAAAAFGVLNWRAQRDIETLSRQALALTGSSPNSAVSSTNGRFEVCNSGPSPVEIREIAVAYWGDAHRLRTFNSTPYNRSGWTLPPSSSQVLAWPQGDGGIWDGSVLFYFARVTRGNEEFLISGRWDAAGNKCLELAPGR